MQKSSELGTTDRRFLLAVTAALVALSSLPYLYGYLRQTSELQYLGLHGFATGDTYVYFSYLRQARDGTWLFSDLYTTEAARVPMVNTFWMVAGQLGRLLRWSVPATFHLARLLVIPLALAVVVWLLAQYLPTIRQRRWGLILAVFASGVSGYLLPFLRQPAYVGGYYHWPPDLWVAESSVFLSAIHSGHMLLALALIVAVFLLVVTAVERRQWRWSVLAGGCALALFSFHPFHAPLIFLVLGSWAVVCSIVARRVRWDIISHVLVVAMAALPMLIYYAWALRVDPVTAGRAAQNVAWTPAWYLLFLGYGFLIPFAVVGIFRVVRERMVVQPYWLLLVTWLTVQMMLVLWPTIAFQRRLLTGLQLPLVILAVTGFPVARQWLKHFAPRLTRSVLTFPGAFAVLFVFFFGFTNLVNFANDIGLMYERNPLVFWPREQVAAIVAVRDLTGPQSVVLASPTTSYLIPGLTGRRVVTGHGIETLDDEAKRVAITWFYGSDSPRQRQEFLARYGVTHVFAGPREQAVGLDALPYLASVYDNGVVKIYRVERIPVGRWR